MLERTPESKNGPAGLDALLQPSLAHTGLREPLYSVRAGFVVAFFGGLFASLLFSGLNSRRLGRTHQDAWLYAVIACIWAASLLWLGYAEATQTLPSWLSVTRDAHRDIRYASRALALAVFGLCYSRLRQFYVAATLAGQDPPNPWKAGLSCAAIGSVLTYLIAALGASLSAMR